MNWTVLIGSAEWQMEMPESDIGDRSRAFICPFCLHVWAALKCESPWQSIFDIESASCESCNVTNFGTDIPGSLLNHSVLRNGWDEDLLNHLPLPLLKRELELHLRIYDSNQYTYDRLFSGTESPSGSECPA